jgi:hypothetical protein
MSYRIDPGVWNHMYAVYERQQAQHQYAIRNSCECECLPCSGERLELQRKAQYEKDLKEYNKTRFALTTYYRLATWS